MIFKAEQHILHIYFNFQFSRQIHTGRLVCVLLLGFLDIVHSFSGIRNKIMKLYLRIDYVFHKAGFN